jgi:hypothetical protein
VREHVAAIRDLKRQRHVLFDEQHRAVVLDGELADDRQQSLDDHRGQPEAELVEQQQLRVPRQRATEGQHLLLAARQQASAPLPEALQRGKVLERDVRVQPLAPVRQLEVLGDCQPEEDAPAIRHVRDPQPGTVGRSHPGEILPGERHAPGEGLDHAGDHPQRRRFPGAVGSEQGHHLARADSDVKIADHRGAVVAGGDPFQAKDEVTHGVALLGFLWRPGHDAADAAPPR